MSWFRCKVYAHGELVTAQHLSGSFWQTPDGAILNLLVPQIVLPPAQELERLIATQHKEIKMPYSCIPLSERFH